MNKSRMNNFKNFGEQQDSEGEPDEPMFIIIFIKRFYLTLLVVTISFLQPLLAQPASAWKNLFNGNDLQGWTKTGGSGKVSVRNKCIVLNMKANTTEHTFLYTNRVYKDFIFEVDCKRDSSFHYGILFRARRAADTAHVRLNGYQVKIDHTSRHWTGGIFDDFGTTWNWLYTLEGDQRAQQAEKRVGEWDHWRIEAFGDNIKVWLNGIPTTHMSNKKYDKGFLAFKIHFLGNDPAREKASAWIKNIRVIDKNAYRYARKMDIPVVEVAGL